MAGTFASRDLIICHQIIWLCARVNAKACMCMYVSERLCVYTHGCVCENVCVNHVCEHECAHLCVSVYVCMYIHVDAC